MATDISKLAVLLTANAAGFSAGLRTAARGVDGFAAHVEGTASRIGGFLASAAALGGGIAAGASIGRGVVDFEQAMADMRAAANPTADQVVALERSILDLSRAAGVGPSDVATAFTELLKAGMSAERVMGGAGAAAVRFARVGQIDVAQAATVMNDALNVFAREGLTATRVVDTLSKAADASSISIHQITEAFAMSSAVFGTAGLTLQDLTTAIGILGNAGVKGSDAGTSLKTMLLRLSAPSAEGATAMRRLGLSVRDAAGHMRPMRDIVGQLQARLAALDPVARDAALKTIFGDDAIRAASILSTQGVAGWDAFTGKLRESLSVAQKYGQQQATFRGGFAATGAALERFGIALGGLVNQPLARMLDVSGRVVEAVTRWTRENGEQIKTVLKWTAAIGGAIFVVNRFVKIGTSIVMMYKAITKSQIATLAFSGPKGWAAIAAGAGITAASVYGLNQLFERLGNEMDRAVVQADQVADAHRTAADATKDVGAAAAAAAGQQAGLSTAIGDVIRKLEEQVVTFGLSQREADLWTLAQEGATDDQIGHARALVDMLDAMEAKQRATERADRDRKKDAPRAPKTFGAEKLTALERRFTAGFTAEAMGPFDKLLKEEQRSAKANERTARNTDRIARDRTRDEVVRIA
jgi:TP901 family phage tail tape measure protein